MSNTILIEGLRSRQMAHRLVEAAPNGYACTVKKPTRSDVQNALMWVLLEKIASQVQHPTMQEFLSKEVWKYVMMRSLGYEVSLAEDLEGNAFPFFDGRSSRLTVSQMNVLIEFIMAEGTKLGADLS